MPVNRFKQTKQDQASYEWSNEIPTDIEWGIYARQSTPAQVVKNTESTEMQTEDLIAWLVSRGVPREAISLFDADLGKSGQLPITEREALLQLVILIEQDIIKAVLVYQVSRLFRDLTAIEYNTFAKICKEHNCLLVTADGFVFNFNITWCMKMYRMLSDMAADFVTQQVGLLHEARRKRHNKGFYAGLGPVPSGFRVDLDKTSKTYKKIIPLPTHQEVVRTLYYRFHELGADNKAQFFRELDALPFLFPEFPLDIDQATKGSNRRRKVPGGYHMSRYAIEQMLCNPVNIGWWVVQGAVIRENHEPLLAKNEEYLFWYAFSQLYPYTIDGEINPNRTRYPTRYTQKDEPREPAGLLKYRATTPQGVVYVHWNKDLAAYKIVHEPSRVMRRSDLEVDVDIIDKAFCDVFFARLRSTNDFDEYRQWVEQETKRKLEKISVIKKQLGEIDELQNDIQDEILSLRRDIRNGKISEKDATAQIERLRLKLPPLETAKIDLQKEKDKLSESTKQKRLIRNYGSFQEELAELIPSWNTKPMTLRRDFVHELVSQVILTIESPRWLRMDIEWDHNLWEADTRYIYRVRGKTPFWTDAEKQVLRNHYMHDDPGVILQLLPTKSWASIRSEAMILGVKREVHQKNSIPIPLHDSWSDYQFKQELQKRSDCQVPHSVKTE